MPRSWTSELPARAGERVLIAGWLHHQRRLSGLTFALVRDGRGVAQVVIDDAEAIERVAKLLPETVIAVEGRAVASDKAPAGIEIHQPTIDVIAEPVEHPPIELRRARLKEQAATILDHAPVALRHPRQRAMFQLAAATLAGFRQALDALGFTEIQTPKIVGGATESGANVFELNYFGRPAYLAQSPQLYKQVMVGVFERVYEVGPVFRAEPHDTPRHLAEYVSLDAELGFIDDHRTVMQAARDAVAGMVAGIADRALASVAFLGVDLPVVPEQIPVVHFSEAQRLIGRATGAALAGEPDLAPAHERWLGEWALREHGSDFVFVEGFPLVKRPFYTQPDPDRPEFSNSFDLIFRGLELITGGQRLHRYDDYVRALEAREMGTEPLEGYLQAFRYGMPPHGGFAIGLERWTARLVGADNIRETTLFPRDRNRLAP